MNYFLEFFEDLNAVILRYTFSGILKCETPGCAQNAISGKKICLNCIKLKAEIQQIEFFPKILTSLERIETALSSNAVPTTPEQINKTSKIVEGQQDLFIPTIEIPETNIQALNEKRTTIIKNVSKLAKQLNSVNEED
jgi:flagellin-specific chaperone FliS